MKVHLMTLGISLCMIVSSAHAAPPRGPGSGFPPGMGPSPGMTKAMEKLFGENSAFSADVEVAQKAMTMPGKMSFDQGKSRFEIDMSQAKGAGMNAEGAAQMKAMGMDRIVVISRPDKKLSYLIYPGMEAYVEAPEEAAKATEGKEQELKVQTTELGNETVDGHPSIKNKVVVGDTTGTQFEAIVWNAKDLKNFPIKIQQTQQGQETTISYKEVKLTKPAGSQFDPPANYKKYSGMQEMMQEIMMKRMGAGGMPPGIRPPK